MGQGSNGPNLTNYKIESLRKKPYFTNDYGPSAQRKKTVEKKETKLVKSHLHTKKCDTETKPAVHHRERR